MRAFIKCLRWQSDINLSQYGIETCRFANRLSVAAVGRHPNGEQLCELVAKGITFKVLSYKMDQEAPDAMACICHTRNFGNKLVLQEGEWSAIKAIHGVSMVDNADKAQVLAYESFLLKLTNVVPPALLDRDGFSELVALVHRLGGNQHGLVDQLLTFGSLMVNHRTTKLRWNAFHTINMIDANASHTILAVLYKTYNHEADPTTRHVPDPPIRWAHVGANPQWLDACEQMLRYVNQERIRTLLEETNDKSERFNFATQLCMKQTDIAIRVIDAVEERTSENHSSQHPSIQLLRGSLRKAVRGAMVFYGIPFDRLPSPPTGMEWLTSATAEKRKHDSLDEPHTYSVAQHGSAHDVVQQRPEQ